MRTPHYTDAILDEFAADALAEARSWEDPVECAAHFISLNRLAAQRPADFAARNEWLQSQ